MTGAGPGAGRTIYVVRHGQTEWNVARRMQGRLDSPLTELGRNQADLHGRTLRTEGDAVGPVECLIASPLGRTVATAELVNAHLDAPLRFEPALMERDCGDWSGLTLDEIEAGFPDDWQARGADPYHHRPPGGENLPDMESRVSALLDDVRHGAERVVALVTHGVMSRAILKCLLNLSPGEAVTVKHPNGAFYRVDLAAERSGSAYYLDGAGPVRGWLR